METQYLYSQGDIKKPGNHQYVYLYAVKYETFKNEQENEVFERVMNKIIPEGVITIEVMYFYECKKSYSKLPSTVRNLAEFAFSRTKIKKLKYN